MKIRIKLIINGLVSIFALSISAQTIDNPKNLSVNKFGLIKSHFEIAANATTVISRFSGNLTQALEEDPYLIAGKYYFAKPRIAVRLGINGDYQHAFKTLTTSQIETIDKQLMPLIGFEFRKVVSPKFEIYSGLDYRLYRESSFLKTTAPNSIDNELLITKKGYGFGPNFGFVFFLSKNIRLFTEANLYFNTIVLNRTIKTSLGTETLENTETLSFKPVVPASLFLSICF